MHVLQSFLNGLFAPIQFLSSRIARLISLPRRFLGLSLPARITLVLATVLLVTLAIAAVRWHVIGRGRHTVGDTLLYLGCAFATVAVISVIIYQAVRLWLEGGLSPYPDIDEAWRTGLAALAANRLTFQDLPVFLIIGSPDAETTRHFMRAADLKGPVDCVPEGRSPLTWYATERAVHLVLTDLGCLGHLNRLAREKPGRTGSPAVAGATPDAEIRRTMLPGGGAGGIRETARPTASKPTAAPPPDIRGTMKPELSYTSKPGAGRASAESSGGQMLSSGDIDEQSQRLAHVCQLLRRERNPVCPLNGIITILPYLVLSDVIVAKSTPKMVRHDLETIRNETRINCLTAALICGMESEIGFFELVRRLGPENTKDNRAGSRFDPETNPTQENMVTLARQACGWFEIWVYHLFRQTDGLSQSQANRKLFTLLAKVRRDLYPRLEAVLTSAFSSEENAVGNPPLMFGTYFAATGNGPSGGELYGFVRGVLNRFDEEFNELPNRPSPEHRIEWTRPAVDEDKRYAIWTRSLYIVNGLLFAAIVLAAVAFIARHY